MTEQSKEFIEALASAGLFDHPQAQPDCPPLPLIAAAANEGWPPERRAHAAQCVLCRKTTAMQWNVAPPSLLSLARHRADDTFPHDKDLARLVDRPALTRIRALRDSWTVASIAAALNAGDEALAIARSLSAVAVPRWEVQPAFAPTRQEQPAARATSADGSITVDMYSEDGALIVDVQSDASHAGRRVEVVIQSDSGTLRREMTLRPVAGRAFGRASCGASDAAGSNFSANVAWLDERTDDAD